MLSYASSGAIDKHTLPVLVLKILHWFQYSVQAVWRWLLDGAHGVDKSYRQKLMQSFKDILYSDTDTAAADNYEKLRNLTEELKCDQFQRY